MAGEHDNKTVVVAAAIDDSYIEPLLVALRSACRQLSPNWSLHVFIIGYEISPKSKQRLRDGLEDVAAAVMSTTEFVVR